MAVRQSTSRDGQHELARDPVGDACQDLVFVGDVLVQRHRLDAQVLAEPAHRDRAEPLPVGQLDGSVEDPLAAERRRRLGGGGVVVGHHPSFGLDRITT